MRPRLTCPMLHEEQKHDMASTGSSSEASVVFNTLKSKDRKSRQTVSMSRKHDSIDMMVLGAILSCVNILVHRRLFSTQLFLTWVLASSPRSVLHKDRNFFVTLQDDGVSHEAISQDRSATIITNELVPPASIIHGYAWQVSVSRKANKPLHRWRPFTSPLKDHLFSVSASALYSPLVGTVLAVGPLEGRRDLNVTMGGRKADPTSKGHTGNGLDHQMQGITKCKAPWRLILTQDVTACAE
jgi:hypothetical protein